MSLLLRVLAITGLAASCVESGLVECEAFGLQCPVGNVCTPIGCADPAQVAACLGAVDDQPCQTVRIEAGVCWMEVCVAMECGDGRVVGDETCDDGNQIDNDGCSASCRSTEMCGNGIVDPVRGEGCDDGQAGLSRDGCSSSCTTELPEWIDRTPAAVLARTNHALVYDSHRDRVVMFGGTVAGGYGDTAEWDGARWRRPDLVVAPTPRGAPSLAFDSRRNVVVLFGGDDGLRYDETWTYDGDTWIRMHPPASPPRRANAAMAYDAARDQTILFGGVDATGSPLGDTWVWNGATWSPVTTAAGPAAGPALMAVDPTDGAILLDPNTVTWIWSGTTWMPRGSANPPRRAGGALAATSYGLVLFGGVELPLAVIPRVLDDTWRWSNGSWTQVTPSPLMCAMPLTPCPRPRVLAAAVGVADRVLMFGGANLANFEGFDELWTLPWSGSSWAKVTTAPVLPDVAVPAAAVGKDLVYQRARETTLLVYRNPPVIRTWEWDGSAWTDRTGSSPPQLSDFSVNEAADGEVILLGTRQGASETWTWNGMMWQQRSVSMAPSPRRGAALAYDVRRRKVVLFGGDAAASPLMPAIPMGDTWEWNGASWNELHPAESPAPRSDATTAFDPIRGTIVMFGGRTTAGEVDETWEFDGVAWRQLTTEVSPSPRHGAHAAWHADRKRVMIYGGIALFANAETWELVHRSSPLGPTWERVATDHQPAVPGDVPIAYDARRGQLVACNIDELWTMRFASRTDPPDQCREVDTDDDGLTGCGDPDCWARCDPWCSPGVTGCAPERPRCGDQHCDLVENAHVCAVDCSP